MPLKFHMVCRLFIFSSKESGSSDIFVRRSLKHLGLWFTRYTLCSIEWCCSFDIYQICARSKVPQITTKFVIILLDRNLS